MNLLKALEIRVSYFQNINDIVADVISIFHCRLAENVALEKRERKVFVLCSSEETDFNLLETSKIFLLFLSWISFLPSFRLQQPLPREQLLLLQPLLSFPLTSFSLFLPFYCLQFAKDDQTKIHFLHGNVNLISKIFYSLS